VSACKHRRYTVDVHEQTGRCMDCGAEGRMLFVVGDVAAAERERCAGACDHFAAGLADARLAEALRDMAALMRALGPN